MSRPSRFSPEVRERGVRMVLEHADQYDSQWAAIRSIAEKLGYTAETLRSWVRPMRHRIQLERILKAQPSAASRSPPARSRLWTGEPGPGTSDFSSACSP